jgi:hypothetical protein
MRLAIAILSLSLTVSFGQSFSPNDQVFWNDATTATNAWVALIPVMVDTNLPSGFASASSCYDGNTPAWHAFTVSDTWSSQVPPIYPEYLQYDFVTNSFVVNKCVCRSDITSNPWIVDLKAGHNTNSFVTLSTFTNDILHEYTTNVFANSVSYSVYRWTFTGQTNGGTDTVIMREVQLWGY